MLATFTHAQRGSDEVVRLLRGMVTGFGAFALFFFTLAVCLRGLGTGPAFALATALALATQAVVLYFARHEPVQAAAFPRAAPRSSAGPGPGAR